LIFNTISYRVNPRKNHRGILSKKFVNIYRLGIYPNSFGYERIIRSLQALMRRCI
jgi:hypothetical protein